MQGEFESDVRQAAVGAVERRFAMKESAELRARSRARASGCFSCLALLAGLVGIGYFLVRHFDLEVPVVSDLVGCFSSKGVFREVTKDEVERRNAFAASLAAFRNRDMKMWLDAPAEVKPKSAPLGMRWLVLCGRDEGGCWLFEMVSAGKSGLEFSFLSPFAEPQDQTPAQFRAAVTGRPSFILCGDVVYACGVKDVAAGRSALAGLLSDVGR